MRCCIFVHRAIEDTLPHPAHTKHLQPFSSTPHHPTISLLRLKAYSSTPFQSLQCSLSGWLPIESFNRYWRKRSCFLTTHLNFSTTSLPPYGTLLLGQGEDGPANLRVVRGSRINQHSANTEISRFSASWALAGKSFPAQ